MKHMPKAESKDSVTFAYEYFLESKGSITLHGQLTLEGELCYSTLASIDCCFDSMPKEGHIGPARST